MRFYRNDGPDGAPGTLLHASEPIPLGRHLNEVRLPLDSLWMPDTVTWTFQANGLTGEEASGLELGDPPSSGTSDANAFWLKSGNWVVWNFGADPANSLARVSAAAQAGAPFMIADPASVVARPGSNATFVATVRGSAPWLSSGASMAQTWLPIATRAASDPPT